MVGYAQQGNQKKIHSAKAKAEINLEVTFCKWSAHGGIFCHTWLSLFAHVENIHIWKHF